VERRSIAHDASDGSRASLVAPARRNTLDRLNRFMGS
jgi:hypothetical protein